MTIRKKAMTNTMKSKTISDFLDQMGVRVLRNAKSKDRYVAIWNELVSAMYSVMDVKVIDIDDLGQMLNLWLAGMNPSAWWSQGKIRETGEGVDKAQQFLGAFSDRSQNVWNDLWRGDQESDEKQLEAITTTFRRMKTTLKQRAKDELRAERSRTRDTVSTGGGGDTEEDAMYQSQMEGEINRSVSVGQTFNLNSWDEISAAGRRDEKVGAAVNHIVAIFEQNSDSIARAIVDIAFASSRNADPFEFKLFQIGMGVGDFTTTVNTEFGDIVLNENVVVARPPKLRSSNWLPNIADYLIVKAFPEMRNLLVLPKGKAMPEDLKDLAGMKCVRPFSNAHIALPSEMMITKADINGSSDAMVVVSNFNLRDRSCKVKKQGDILAITQKDFKSSRDLATKTISQKWVKGKRGRKKPFWKAGMDCIVRQVQITDSDPSKWLDHDPVPTNTLDSTKLFVRNFRLLLIRALTELNEAHGYYEIRNKRFAKKKEAKPHRLASKIAYRWIQQRVKS